MSDNTIREVRISSADVDDEDPYALCNSVEMFLRVALDEAGYEPDELPDDAADFVDLMLYYGEWQNGGHETCRGNIDDVESWRRASRLLSRMGLADHKAILDDFIEFSILHDDLLRDLYEEGEETRARRLFDGFNERFWKLERVDGGLIILLHRWLSQQPWLVIDPQAPRFVPQCFSDFFPVHPQAQARKDAMRRWRMAENHGAIRAFMHRLYDQFHRKR